MVREPQFIEVTEHGGGIVMITLNRPAQKNALSIALRDEVSDALQCLADDETTRVVVLTGEGPVFSAGFDLQEFADADSQQQLWQSSDRFHHAVLRFPLRTIDAAEALQIGLVSAVTSADGLLPEALSRAGAIASAPREVLLAMKAKIIAVANISEDLPTLEL